MTHEEVFIGQVLNNNDWLHQVDVREGDFTSARCAQVYQTINGIVDRGHRADLTTVFAETPNVDIGWLSSLTDYATPSVPLLAEKVIDGGRRHRLSVAVREVAERLNAGESTAAVLEHLESVLTDITEGREDDVATAKEMVKGLIEEFERRHKMKGAIPGITSGIADIDTKLMGFEGSRYYVIGARPSEGKSALLLNFALAALRSGHRVGVITMESSKREFLERAVANLGNVNGTKLRGGFFGHSDMKGIFDAGEYLDGAPLVLADKPNMQLSELKARARRMVRQYHVEMVLVDYVQLIQVAGNATDYERVSRASLELKQLSRELRIPVVAAAQLNRGAEEGKNRKPRLSDFKNSGQIEQDADVAILIYLHEKGKPEEQVWLCIEKNRDGATGDVLVHFDREHLRFAGVE